MQPENRVVLWKRIAKFAAEVGAATIAIVGSLVGFTFHAQKALVLHVLPHSLHFFGIPGTIVLILIEAAIPLTLIFYKRTQRVQQKLFVDVMHIQGVTVEKTSAEERAWIMQQRDIQLRQNSAPRMNMCRTLVDPESLSNRPITKYLITLPLNFFPVAGQAAFCWLNAMDTSTMLHHYYYSKLKGLSPDEEAAVIHFRRSQYQQFGLTATLLDLTPGPNILFLLTNSVGAALWAADLEKLMQKRHSL